MTDPPVVVDNYVLVVHPPTLGLVSGHLLCYLPGGLEVRNAVGFSPGVARGGLCLITLSNIQPLPSLSGGSAAPAQRLRLRLSGSYGPCVTTGG
jgi:hypothetical protein